MEINRELSDLLDEGEGEMTNESALLGDKEEGDVIN